MTRHQYTNETVAGIALPHVPESSAAEAIATLRDIIVHAPEAASAYSAGRALYDVASDASHVGNGQAKLHGVPPASFDRVPVRAARVALIALSNHLYSHVQTELDDFATPGRCALQDLADRMVEALHGTPYEADLDVYAAATDA